MIINIITTLQIYYWISGLVAFADGVIMMLVNRDKFENNENIVKLYIYFDKRTLKALYLLFCILFGFLALPIALIQFIQKKF